MGNENRQLGRAYPAALPTCPHRGGTRQKVSYRSVAAARKAARRSNRQNYDPYKCPHCSYYHLTGRH